MIFLQTPSFGWSFQDGRQLASKPVHQKQRVARSRPTFQISGNYTLQNIKSAITKLLMMSVSTGFVLLVLSMIIQILKGQNRLCYYIKNI